MTKVQEKNIPSLIAFSQREIRQLYKAAKKLIHKEYVFDNYLSIDLNPNDKFQTFVFRIKNIVRTCIAYFLKSGNNNYLKLMRIAID